MKGHLVADGSGRGLAALLSAGQAGDSLMMPAVLEAIAVRGRLVDCDVAVVTGYSPTKAYSSAGNRALSRSKGIGAVIRSEQNRSSIGSDEAVTAVGQRAATLSPTRGVTSSNAPSIRPSTGAVSPPATTNWPRPTQPGLLMALIIEWLNY